ncbi:MAG: hypothetical protein AB7F98_17840 [Novosphingobium sp.]
MTAAFENLFRTRRAQFAWFLIFALVIRASVLGDTNYFNDEYFYFETGLRMHDGILPYVDIWDRKGPGLFLTYWLIAFFSHSVLAFQLAATLAAAATAYVANRIAGHFANRPGAMLGGTLYLVMLGWLGGGGGQTPVFYNLPLALAALAVVRATPRLRQGQMPRLLIAAMAAAGFAITFKQSAICESVFLGCYVLWQLRRGGMALRHLTGSASAMIAAGAMPMLLFAGFYAWAGHFFEFWHAMVTANLTKTLNPAGDHWQRIGSLSVLFAPAWIPALAGLALRHEGDEVRRGFLAGWLLAGLAGVAIVPNFFEHYLLPLCLPASVAAARALGFRLIGPVFGLLAMAMVLTAGPAFDFARRAQSREGMALLAQDIRARDAKPRLFVFGGPVDLYRQFDTYPPTPLIYPLHLYFPAENNVSHLDTAGEVHKVLAWRPSVVVFYHGADPKAVNPRTGPLVRDYVARNCRLWFTRELPELYVKQSVDVWGDCARER